MSISCSICWEVMLGESVLAKLKCGHIYHKHCIDEWIKQSKTCPDCLEKVGKSTRVYLHFKSIDPIDLNVQLMGNADELTKKDNDYQLKIVQLTKELAEKDRNIVTSEKLSQNLMDEFNQVNSLLRAKNQEAVHLNNFIASLESCVESAESILQIKKEVGALANERKDEAIRELHEIRNQLKGLQKCPEFNDLAREFKNVQNENHMQAMELSGSNKLIEALQRVNTELEASQHSLEIENKRLKIQTQAMEESASLRQKAKGQKLNLISEKQ